MSPSKYFIPNQSIRNNQSETINPNQSIGNNQCELFHSINRIFPTKYSLRNTLLHREVECLVKLPEDGHPDSLLVEVVDL